MKAKRTGRQLLQSSGRVVAGALLGLGAVIVAGCTDPKHKDVPPAKVEVVQAYGTNLDENATPQQVAYVLLRSIADDVQAAQAHRHEDQKSALRTTYALAAYSTIERRLSELLKATGATDKEGLGPDRDAALYDFVRQWAAIVGHYVPSFDTDFNAAQNRMSVQTKPDAAHVLYKAWHSPTTQPSAGDNPVLIDIELAKETVGTATYWRVARVSFAGRARVASMPALSTTAPR